MKKKGVNKEKIKEIISSNDTIIEELIEDSKYLLRNKNWEDIKENLVSIEEIETIKKKTPNTKNFNLNYYNMQNNYYYNQPYPFQPLEMNPYGNMNQPLYNNMIPYNMGMYNQNFEADDGYDMENNE